MQVDQDKNGGRTVCMEVAEKVTAVNVGHNMFNGSESSIDMGGVVHS